MGGGGLLSVNFRRGITRASQGGVAHPPLQALVTHSTHGQVETEQQEDLTIGAKDMLSSVFRAIELDHPHGAFGYGDIPCAQCLMSFFPLPHVSLFLCVFFGALDGAAMNQLRRTSR